MKTRPMYKFLLILTITAAVGLQGWRTLYNNFAVDFLKLNGDKIGIIQAIRELPGFLAMLAIFFLYIMSEHILSSLSILLLGIGVALTGFFPSFYGLIFTTIIMSIGFHYYETTNQSLTLQYFDPHEAPTVFGIQRSISALSNIGVGIIIWGFSYIFNFKQMYLIIGCFVVAVAIWSFFQNPADQRSELQLKKMIFKKKYWLFYTLTFLAGARRQIFMVFSILLLVQKFKFSVKEITILFIINNIINYFVCPLISKSILKFGEKKVLLLEYGSLIFIFLIYALSDSKLIVAFLYILDHVFFNFSIAIRTFFQKIGDNEDIAPSMAVSFTINHIAAIILPVIGGYLWIVNYRLPFYIGCGFSILSLFFVLKIPKFKN